MQAAGRENTHQCWQPMQLTESFSQVAWAVTMLTKWHHISGWRYSCSRVEQSTETCNLCTFCGCLPVLFEDQSLFLAPKRPPSLLSDCAVMLHCYGHYNRSCHLLKSLYRLRRVNWTKSVVTSLLKRVMTNFPGLNMSTTEVIRPS